MFLVKIINLPRLQLPIETRPVLHPQCLQRQQRSWHTVYSVQIHKQTCFSASWGSLGAMQKFFVIVLVGLFVLRQVTELTK